MTESDSQELLYTILRGRLGDYVQIDQLVGELNQDRTVIQRHLDSLRGMGVDVEDHPVLGLRLSELPETLVKPELSHGLQTNFFGQTIHRYSEVDSTNDVAGELLKEDVPEGTLIIAEHQRAGRGRRGRDWHSPPQTGLWCSLIIYPHAQTALGFLTLLFGVSIARSIRIEFGIDAHMKWPNDILIDHRKVAGILCEHHGDRDSRTAVVVGFGINVNQLAFPAELAASAISLRQAVDRKTDRSEMLRRILLEMEHDYLCAARGGEAMIMNQARSFSSTLGRTITVDTEAASITGVARELQADGSLVLEDAAGVKHSVRSGDIRHLQEGDPALMPSESQGTGGI